jgi:hypothetical protein
MTPLAIAYRDVWDRRIARWMDGSSTALGANVPDLRGVDTRAVPEPYVGDPGAPGLAVVLSLNPGEAGAAQRPGGATYEAVRRDGYAAVYGRCAAEAGGPAEDTYQWMKNNRAEWPGRLLGTGAGDILHLDLVPWHTRHWSGIAWTDAAVAWAWDEVLSPAGRLAAATELSRRCGRPVVLAVGRPYAALLEAGAVRQGVSSVGSADAGGRHFALHRVAGRGEDAGYDVLVTWARGTNRAPAASHDRIVRALLGLATPA